MLSMMNCPTCGAAMRLDAQKESLRCDHCGQVHFPAPNADGVRVLGGGAGVKCPVCDIELTVAAAGGQQVCFCDKCRGVLIGMDAFRVAAEELKSRLAGATEIPRPMNPGDLKRALRCPKCGWKMDTHPYAGPGNIVIDNCPRCELNWLDHAELRRVAAAPDVKWNTAAWEDAANEREEEEEDSIANWLLRRLTR
jgi:Zn-finger nucleic acid-binding protein